MSPEEINNLVARKLGHNPSGAFITAPNGRHAIWVLSDGRTSHLPDYCHDIKAAWEIVEFVKDRYFCLERGVLERNWCASYNWAEDERGDYIVMEYADTVAMAICLAFLKLP